MVTGGGWGQRDPVAERFPHPIKSAVVGRKETLERDDYRPNEAMSFVRKLSLSPIVRRPQIGELGKQIDVGPDLVPGHPPVR